jgi:hypothetical protein
MKIKSFQKRILGTAIAVLCLMGVHSPFNSRAYAQSTPPPPDSATESGALPANVYPTSPLAQVIQLTQAGVDENIIMTYVTNSGSTFNLDSDKIIYLKDIGLPNEVVTAMMQRDQLLQQQMAVSAYQPPAQPAPTPATTDQPETASLPPTEITVNYFYDALALYGSWVDVDGYGRCWRPSVVIYNSGWQPYCDHGHWVYTDCGWYWFSDYSWGWATFHYGRWFRDSRWGWCWMPDTVWGPSWVTWRYSDDYCGWAPLPPTAVYREGGGFFYQGRNVGIGFDFGLNVNCFTFVPTRYFCDPHPRRYRAVPAQVTQIYNHTAVINNFDVRNHSFVNGGIAPEHITAATRTPIHPISIRDTTSSLGRGPRGDQLSHDGLTLVVNRPHFVDNSTPGGNKNNHPSQFGSPVQNRSPQPKNNQPAPLTRPVGQPQVHNVTTYDPQNRSEFSVPNQTQRPSAPANYSTPNYDSRIFSPRKQQQLPQSSTPRGNTHNFEAPVVAPTPGQGQHNVPGANHYNAPAAVSVERPQRSQPDNESSSAPLSQKSDKQDQNQTGSGSGPRH